ncbi:MAG: tetratricopeptide repeat protein [Bacteroidales bacterium]|jgi:hypothetical protein|nr:tetratricopeptide repeat protein [Bacteroidales bacterium]
MPHSRYRYIFIAAAILMLPLLAITGRKAGISCDEVLHYNHSVAVYKYFATHGADTSALWTPVTNLRHYGQAYDNIATILIRWLGIDDIYAFRHLMSAFAGWLVILITALFAVWLGGYRNGLIVLFLFAVSPTFIGHAWNNLKDVPFALGYIASAYFTIKFISAPGRAATKILIFITLSMAFTLSIRAGGLIVFCYLVFFTFISFVYRYVNDGSLVLRDLWIKSGLVIVMILAAWLLGILLWPYALREPLGGVIGSYRVMAHFPDTFRQVFEGRVEWSDFMPWYYLPKSMLITIPITVLSGLLVFIFTFRRIISGKKGLQYSLILFTLLFPVVFVFYERPNLYSSWRQFLFLYPPLVLLAAAGFEKAFELSGYGWRRYALSAVIILLSVHPMKYMAQNLPYSYIYYNQLTGGTAGAYARYELDYYFTGQTMASEWLKKYLREKGETEGTIVKATYSVSWQFRDLPGVHTGYFRWEERSMEDWDYAIVTNRYIPPFQLNNGIWPPGGTIHTEYADGVPVCVVVKRTSFAGLRGYRFLQAGNLEAAEEQFKKALEADASDEMIFFNFAAVLVRKGEMLRADSLLKAGLSLNPDSDQILMYLGNIAKAGGRNEEAALWYRRLTGTNRKYFEAYVGHAEAISGKDPEAARKVLKDCLLINPRFSPAIVALGDTYRETHPELAAKYYKLAGTIK